MNVQQGFLLPKIEIQVKLLSILGGFHGSSPLYRVLIVLFEVSLILLQTYFSYFDSNDGLTRNKCEFLNVYVILCQISSLILYFFGLNLIVDKQFINNLINHITISLRYGFILHVNSNPHRYEDIRSCKMLLKNLKISSYTLPFTTLSLIMILIMMTLMMT